MCLVGRYTLLNINFTVYVLVFVYLWDVMVIIWVDKLCSNWSFSEILLNWMDILTITGQLLSTSVNL